MTAGLRASVIVNNFNYARFLPAAIDSALAQTHPDTEVIVVDDGSTDSSAAVIGGYSGRITPVLKANGGQASAYNAGFDASSGDVVAFLDADDLLLPDAIATAAERFADDGVVKVQWPMLFADATGRTSGELSTKEPPPDGWLVDRVAREGPLYDFNHQTNGAYRRALLDRVLPMPEPPYRNGADVYLLSVAPVYGLVDTVPRPLSVYRLHDDNNYVRRPLDEDRLRDYIRRYDTNAEHVAAHLVRVGRSDVDPARWRATAFNHLWPTRLLAVWKDISAVIPDGATFVLIDGGDWGATENIGARVAVPLIDHDGVDGGPPADATEAVEGRVRSRHAEGVRFVVLWWTCDWWVDAYPELFRFLERVSRRATSTDGAVIFELPESLDP